jgi:hypothetical protein
MRKKIAGYLCWKKIGEIADIHVRSRDRIGENNRYTMLGRR